MSQNDASGCVEPYGVGGVSGTGTHSTEFIYKLDLESQIFHNYELKYQDDSFVGDLTF